jgi:hypothetical protein
VPPGGVPFYLSKKAKNMFDKKYQFYPTPLELGLKMVEGLGQKLDQNGVTILEPGAGRGDLVNCIVTQVETEMKEKYRELLKDHPNWHLYYREEDKQKLIDRIHTCEIQPDLQNILTGKGYKVVAEDFLNYHPPFKYDFIFMNPPFRTADHHFMHAWELLAPGGQIIGLCNAQSYPGSKFSEIMEDNEGTSEMLLEAFKGAPRQADVTVLMLKVTKPAEERENLFDSLKFDEANYKKVGEDGEDLTPAKLDVIGNLVKQYNAAIDQYLEFKRAQRRINYLNSVLGFSSYRNDFDTGSTTSKGKDQQHFNDYCRELANAAWRTVFNLTKIESRMTQAVREQFEQKKKEVFHLAFTKENISKVLDQVIYFSKDILGQCVEDVFDELTKYTPENREAIEGFKTNSNFRVRKKMIIAHPVTMSIIGGDYEIRYNSRESIRDIDRAMCYLLGKKLQDIKTIVETVKKGNQDKQGESEFFFCRWFKKGTLHLEFKDQALRHRFNRFVAERRGWLHTEEERHYKRETEKSQKKTRKKPENTTKKPRKPRTTNKAGIEGGLDLFNQIF